MKASLEQFKVLLEGVLDKKIESVSNETKPADIEGWDSLNHVFLIVKLESHYKIKFSTAQVQKWNNIGDILNDIDSYMK